MYKFFILAGDPKYAEKRLKLSLPKSKHFHHQAIKGGEQEPVNNLIEKAVITKKVWPWHKKPYGKSSYVPRSLQQILTRSSYPLSQGPVVLPIDCNTEAKKSVVEVLTDKTVFNHSDSQSCYEWVPVETGVSAWEKVGITFCVKPPEMSLSGAASLRNMGQVYTCSQQGCVVHCPCRICRDVSADCRVICRDHPCTACTRQCSEHSVKLPRLFNVDTDHFMLVTQQIDLYQFAHPFAGIPLSCNLCSRDVNEHSTLHLTFHLACKFCKVDFRPFQRKDSEISFAKFKVSVDLNEYTDNRTCATCLIKLPDYFARRKHEEHVHEGKEKDFKCQECEKVFSNSNALKYHQEVTHQQLDKPLPTCDECGKKFTSERNLERHSRVVHMGLKHECDICKRVFARKDVLQRHKKEKHLEFVHHNLNYVTELTHFNAKNCSQCEKTFKRNSHLKRHVEIVHGEGKANKDDHSCEFCGKSFAWKTSLNRHVKQVHSEN